MRQRSFKSQGYPTWSPNLHLSAEAAQSADDYLSDSGYEPQTVQRRLLKSYGVLSRVPFNDAEHDANYMVKDYKDEKWCNNVVYWMACKVYS